MSYDLQTVAHTWLQKYELEPGELGQHWETNIGFKIQDSRKAFAGLRANSCQRPRCAVRRMALDAPAASKQRRLKKIARVAPPRLDLAWRA